MLRIRTRQFIVLLLGVFLLASAGCAGLGTDSPAENPEGETDGNGEAQEGADSPNETSDPSGNDSGGENGSTDGTDEGSDGSVSSDDDPSQSSSDDADSSGDESSGSDASGSDPSDSSGTDGSDTSGSSDEAEGSDTDSGSDTSGDTDADGSDESNETDGSNSDSDTDGDVNDTDATNDNEDENGDDGDEAVYTLTVEADSEVTIERHSDGATTTREPTDGTVEFSVYAGEYTVSADRYQSQEVTVEGDQDVALQEDQRDGTTQTIEVVHANEDDAPLPATVTLRGEDGETYTEDTGDDGVVEFTVPDGIYDYEIEPHQDGEFGLAMSYAGDLRVGSDDFPDPFEIQMYSPPADVSASMTVVDAETGEPIEGATIQGTSPNMNHPWRPAFSVETDANGQYDGTIPDTVTTGYDYEVDAEGYQDERGTAMTAEEMANHTFELEPESEGETYNATITVQDENGAPVDGATVAMSGQNETTDGGEATFEVDVPGGYTVTVSDVDGYERTQETVMVEEDGENEFTIALQSTTLVAA